jgi:hypothetical protein
VSVGAITEAVAKQQRMMEIEKKLAYECARGDIGSFCIGEVVDGKQWFVTKVPLDEKLAAFTQECVDEAIEYLELRCLLERHPTQPWIHVMEVPA